MEELSPNSADRYVTLRETLSEGRRQFLDELVADKGEQFLENDVPYLLVAIRNRERDEFRRLKRELRLASGEHLPSASSTISLDPAAVVTSRIELDAAIEALRDLDQRDALLLWWTAEGYSLDEIAKKWHDAKLKPAEPGHGYLRTRRSRARVKLASALTAAGYGTAK